MLGHVITDAVLRLARGENVDDCGARILVSVHYCFVKMIRMSTRGLSNVDILVHHADVCEFLAVFFLSMNDFSMEAHLCILTFEGTCGRLSACIGVDLGVE